MLIKELFEDEKELKYVVLDILIEYDNNGKMGLEKHKVYIDARDTNSAKRIETEIQKHIRNQTNVWKLGYKLHADDVNYAFIKGVKIMDSIPRNSRGMLIKNVTEKELKELGKSY